MRIQTRDLGQTLWVGKGVLNSLRLGEARGVVYIHTLCQVLCSSVGMCEFVIDFIMIYTVLLNEEAGV